MAWMESPMSTVYVEAKIHDLDSRFHGLGPGSYHYREHYREEWST